MCLAVGKMPDGHPSAESEEGSSSSETVSGDTSTEESVEEETPGPKAAARPPEPHGEPPCRRDSEWREEDWAASAKGRGKSEGKQKKGHGKSDGKCRYCWKRVKGGAAAMSQHEWWSESCLAWQYYKAGYDWERAKRMATATKNQRMVQDYGTVESSDEEARREVARTRKRGDSRVDKSWVPGPYVKEKRRNKDKDKKGKKKVSHKAKKEKVKKRRKSSTTASRSPVRDRRRRPPSSDSTEGGKKRDRDGAAKRNAPRTLVIRI